MSEEPKSIIPGIGFAVMTARKELLTVTMRSLRTQAAEGALTGTALDTVLDTLEGLCETLIDARRRRAWGDEEED
jgi:hypothetical protein